MRPLAAASRSGHHAATLSAGSPGVLHGNRTYLLQDEAGQIIETHSISAGLDYPGVGPEHSLFEGHRPRRVCAGPPTSKRWRPSTVCAVPKGIIPALESEPCLGARHQAGADLAQGPATCSICLSGRGDKDIGTVADLSGSTFYCRPSCRGEEAKGVAFLKKEVAQ